MSQAVHTRVGIGYDVHRFAEGRKLVLGGVEIPHPLGLAGHSDADVLCHAAADAVLGAAGELDIGHHFPPSDPAIEGISSLVILEKVRAIVMSRGGAIQNLDCTIVAEQPKILPHAEEMKARMSRALGISPNQIGVKATTNEGLGFLGRAEGICAMAVAAVEFPT